MLLVFAFIAVTAESMQRHRVGEKGCYSLLWLLSHLVLYSITQNQRNLC